MSAEQPLLQGMYQKAQAYAHKVSLQTEWLTISAQFLILKTETALRANSRMWSKKYARIAPKLADWIEVNLPEGFSVFAFTRIH